jgi:hypothetical protein
MQIVEVSLTLKNVTGKRSKNKTKQTNKKKECHWYFDRNFIESVDCFE